MSLLANHGVISGYRIPALIQTIAEVVSSDSYVVTPGSTPTSGNVMVVCIGGVQSRAVISPPTDWVPILLGVGHGTNIMYWKVATGSEPSSYAFGLSGSLNGSYRFLEFSNLQTSSLTLVGTNSFGDFSAATSVSPVSSYNMLTPGVAITTINLDSTGVWSADGGFTNQGGSGEFDTAYKIYNAVALGEDVNWTTAGAAQTGSSRIVTLRAKTI